MAWSWYSLNFTCDSHCGVVIVWYLAVGDAEGCYEDIDNNDEHDNHGGDGVECVTLPVILLPANEG